MSPPTRDTLTSLRHGVTVMRASPDTRTMVIGFAGGILWPLVGGALMVLARGLMR